jgi:hypothetical protein
MDQASKKRDGTMMVGQDGRPNFVAFAKALRAEAAWSAAIHRDDKTGAAASDQRSLIRLAEHVEQVARRYGCWSESKRTVRNEDRLIAPPTNTALSTEPNKTQTLMNIVAAEGPMTRDCVIERMQEVLGPERAVNNHVRAIMYHLIVCSKRLHHDPATDIVSIAETNAPNEDDREDSDD